MREHKPAKLRREESSGRLIKEPRGKAESAIFEVFATAGFRCIRQPRSPQFCIAALPDDGLFLMPIGVPAVRVVFRMTALLITRHDPGRYFRHFDLYCRSHKVHPRNKVAQTGTSVPGGNYTSTLLLTHTLYESHQAVSAEGLARCQRPLCRPSPWETPPDHPAALSHKTRCASRPRSSTAMRCPWQKRGRPRPSRACLPAPGLASCTP